MPRTTVAARAESSADARPRTTVTTSPAATTAPRAATTRRTRAAGDEDDAPARQGDQSERTGQRHVAAGVVDQRGAGLAVGRGPGLAPGQRRQARADEAEEDGGAEQAAAVSHAPPRTRRPPPTAGRRRSTCARRCGTPDPPGRPGAARCRRRSRAGPPCTHWRWPEVSPLTQYSPRLRLQYVARPVARVRASASSSIHPSISTSPVSCCWAIAGTSPASLRRRRSETAGSRSMRPSSHRGVRRSRTVRGRAPGVEGSRAAGLGV